MIVASVKPSPSEGWRAQSGLWRWADLGLRKSVTNLRSLLPFVMSSFDLTRAREFCLASFNMHTLNEVTSWTVHLTLSIIISATEWFHGNCFNNCIQAYFSENRKKLLLYLVTVERQTERTPVKVVNGFAVWLPFQTCAIPSLLCREG